MFRVSDRTERWLIIAVSLLMIFTLMADIAQAGEAPAGPDCEKEPEKCQPVDCKVDPDHRRCQPPSCETRPDHPKCEPKCDPKTDPECDRDRPICEKDPTLPECNPCVTDPGSDACCEKDPSSEGCNEPPTLECPVDALTVSWETELGTIVGTATAEDPDGDELTFSGTDADGYLEVNSAGSIVLVSAIPPTGIEGVFIVLPVTVTDGITEPVTVECEIETQGVSGFDVAERIYASRAPGFTVWEPEPELMYADGQTWTITSGNEAGYFAIDESTGVVTVASNLPRPAKGALGVSERPGPDGQTDRQVDYPLAIEITIPEGIIPGTLTVRTVDFFDDDDLITNDLSPYEDSINWLGDPAVAPWLRPITSGCNGAIQEPPKEAPVYCPENPTRRWHMAVFVTRMAMVVAEPPATPDPPLSVLVEAGWDDSINHPRARWIAAMLVSNFSDGCGLPVNAFDGRAVGEGFCPDTPITWGQASAFIRRAFGPAIDGSTSLGLSQEIPSLEWLIRVGATGDLLPADQPLDADDEVRRDVMARVLETTWGLTGG